MATPQINIINNTVDNDALNLAIYQKYDSLNSGMEGVEERSVIAWKVIKIVDINTSHSFTISTEMHVTVEDENGNVSDPQATEGGVKWNAVSVSAGTMLVNDIASGSNASEIQIYNGLDEGAINASIYKDNKLLATQMNIAPQQSTAFAFEPTIWVGVVPQAVEGEIIDPLVLSTITTEISLLGITNANLILTGGSGNPYLFSLVPLT